MLKPDATPAAPGSPADPQVFDQKEALARIDGDAELLAEMATLFIESHSEQVSAIRAGLVAGDIKAVKGAAHALKGAVANFTSRGAFQSAKMLEEMARNGDLSGAGAVLTELEGSLNRLTCALQAFCHRMAHPADSAGSKA